MNIVDQIKEKARQLGFTEVGICDASIADEPQSKLESWLERGYHATMDWMARTRKERANPKSFFPQAESIVVTAYNYFREGEPISRPVDEGNISIYARGRDYHKVVRKKLKLLFDYIQTLLPEVKGRICVDSFPIMEKPLAVRAGIGWIGKHTNLILKGKGSYFFLGEILLSEKLPADEPLTADYCGTCNRCQTACPTNALEDAYILDSNRCISYLTIEHPGEIEKHLQQGMGNWVFGCDICQEVCPWNRFSGNTTESDFANRVPVEWYKLERLKKMSETEFKKLFTGTPVLRAGYENFIRNVKIAFENFIKKIE